MRSLRGAPVPMTTEGVGETSGFSDALGLLEVLTAHCPRIVAGFRLPAAAVSQRRWVLSPLRRAVAPLRFAIGAPSSER
jgi:hypothetical protein